MLKIKFFILRLMLKRLFYRYEKSFSVCNYLLDTKHCSMQAISMKSKGFSSIYHSPNSYY